MTPLLLTAALLAVPALICLSILAMVVADSLVDREPPVKKVGRHRPPVVVDSVVIRSEPVLGGVR
jgi:hypothetical protein